MSVIGDYCTLVANNACLYNKILASVDLNLCSSQY